jgi:hypothetical protein
VVSLHSEMRIDAFKRRGFLVIITIQALAVIGHAQTSSSSLQKRIGKADLEKYSSVTTAKNWENPYLVICVDGIKVLNATPLGHAMPVESVQKTLEGLPNSAWPYGLVVAIQDNAVQTTKDRPKIEANRKQLVLLLKKLGVKIDYWPPV